MAFGCSFDKPTLSKCYLGKMSTVEGRIDSATVISTFNAFANYYAVIYMKNKQPCVVIIDNASVHTSHNFLAIKTR